MTEPPARPALLLADDEPAIAGQLAPFLERAGFDVTTVADGAAALALAGAQPFDVMVLDVMMPRMDGREALRRMRAAGRWTPVILLTQVGDSSERAMALEEGADDYLNKPFDPRELVARIRALLRRAQAGRPPLSASRTLRCGDLTLDRTARRALLGRAELPLTPKAVALLEYLMTHPDELISRERLLDQVWGWDYPAGTRAVDTRIAELRRALADDPDSPRFIETVTGQGYRFAGAVEAGP